MDGMVFELLLVPSYLGTGKTPGKVLPLLIEPYKFVYSLGELEASFFMLNMTFELTGWTGKPFLIWSMCYRVLPCATAYRQSP
jgi:hypothetical protein